jgi:hypothetical protein
MSPVSDHFSKDFSAHRTEILPSPTATVGNAEKQISVQVQYHHNSKLRQSFMSLLRPGDLGAIDLEEFYNLSITHLSQRCIIESTVFNFPAPKPSTDVYVYTDAVHDAGIRQGEQLRIIKRGANYVGRKENLSGLINSFALSYKQEDRECYKRAAQHTRILVEAALRE